MTTSDEQTQVQPDRRNILTVIVIGLGALLFSAVIYPVLSFVNPPKRNFRKVNSAVVATEAEILPNTGKVISFNREKVFILNKDGEYHAMSAICTHLGCTVQWKPDEQLVWCACHNARYDTEGKIISGPQPRSLAPYNLTVQDGNLILFNNPNSQTTT
jgi:cytochrome b6-f complex iron-sulfur subunit